MAKYILAVVVAVALFHVSAALSIDGGEWLKSKDLEKDPKEFPCPDEAAIEPCFCSFRNNQLILDCTNITAETQLYNVFQQEFPVKEFYSFRIFYNEFIQQLSFDTNGVSFERLNLFPGPFKIYRISDDFLKASLETMQDIIMQNTQLTYDTFPFGYLNDATKLQNLIIDGSQISEVHRFDYAPALRNFHLNRSNVTNLVVGTFNKPDYLYDIELSYNQVSRLPIRVFPVYTLTVRIKMDHNDIRFLGSGTFFDATSDQLTAGLSELWLNDNRLVQLNSQTIPLTRTSEIIHLENNEITAITATDTFFKMSEPDLRSIQLFMGNNMLSTIEEDRWLPVINYLSVLDLQNNPLSCGCDIAWLVMNTAYINKVSAETTCTDGQRVIDLDPQVYNELCF